MKESITELEDLIDSADVVFLLTDTRESRWLPTLICSAKHKVFLLLLKKPFPENKNNNDKK